MRNGAKIVLAQSCRLIKTHTVSWKKIIFYHIFQFFRDK